MPNPSPPSPENNWRLIQADTSATTTDDALRRKMPQPIENLIESRLVMCPPPTLKMNAPYGGVASGAPEKAV